MLSEKGKFTREVADKHKVTVKFIDVGWLYWA